MKEEITVIRIRRGHGKARYCACDEHGNPIMGFHKLSDVRKHWEKEIRWGKVKLIRELDKTPNLETINKTIDSIDQILKSICMKKNKAGGDHITGMKQFS